MAANRTFVAGTATAVAPVAAIPTTAAHFSLFNGEAAGGKSYIITALGMTTTTTAGATMILQMLAHMSVGNVTGISGTLANGPKPTDGNPVPSLGQVKSAVTIILSGVWHPVGPSFNTAALTATIGAGLWVPVRGLYTVPPGQIFSLATLGSTTGGACQLYINYEEAQL
jgi:hypothetical protein